MAVVLRQRHDGGRVSVLSKAGAILASENELRRWPRFRRVLHAFSFLSISPGAISVPASMAQVKVFQNRVWGIKSADPMSLVVVSLVLTIVGLAACRFPACARPKWIPS